VSDLLSLDQMYSLPIELITKTFVPSLAIVFPLVFRIFMPVMGSRIELAHGKFQRSSQQPFAGSFCI